VVSVAGATTAHGIVAAVIIRRRPAALALCNEVGVGARTAVVNVSHPVAVALGRNAGRRLLLAKVRRCDHDFGVTILRRTLAVRDQRAAREHLSDYRWTAFAIRLDDLPKLGGLDTHPRSIAVVR
jgi:hypothetical protein